MLTMEHCWHIPDEYTLLRTLVPVQYLQVIEISVSSLTIQIILGAYLQVP